RQLKQVARAIGDKIDGGEMTAASRAVTEYKRSVEAKSKTPVGNSDNILGIMRDAQAFYATSQDAEDKTKATLIGKFLVKFAELKEDDAASIQAMVAVLNEIAAERDAVWKSLQVNGLKDMNQQIPYYLVSGYLKSLANSDAEKAKNSPVATIVSLSEKMQK